MNPVPPLAAMLVTVFTITLLLRGGWGHSFQDVPNARSLHAAPVPRSGGIALMAGMLIGMAWAGLPPWWLLLPVLLLFALSLLDDYRGLSVRQRLPLQGVAALLLLAGSEFFVQHGLIATLVAALLVVWALNLYNFMDGSDGLAGGMALFGFGALAAAAALGGAPLLAAWCAAVSAAAFGFLLFNFHPARLFMGDAGSIPLGFLAAALGLAGWQADCWPAWFPLLVFSPFWVDASVTLLRRSLRGDRVTEAHREHYYQRLVRMGAGHRRVALGEYAVMAAAALSALWLRDVPAPWGLWGGWVLGYAALMWRIDRAWRQREAA